MCVQGELNRIERPDRNLHNNYHRVSEGVTYSYLIIAIVISNRVRTNKQRQQEASWCPGQTLMLSPPGVEGAGLGPWVGGQMLLLGFT